MLSKRGFDIGCALLGLVMLAPLFLVVAMIVKLDSPGPIFFRQERVGWHGRRFFIFKFRTMLTGAEAQGQITVRADARVTGAGRWLRRFKLDELPQLINVLRGEMSLVGPRPEVPRYVARYPDHLREQVLSVRPGITDLASIAFRDENALLANAFDAERAYIDEIMPRKLEYYSRYVRERSFWGDVRIIVLTLLSIC